MIKLSELGKKKESTDAPTKREAVAATKPARSFGGGKGASDDSTASDKLAATAEGKAPKAEAASASTGVDKPTPKLAGFGVAKPSNASHKPVVAGADGDGAGDASPASASESGKNDTNESGSVDGVSDKLDALESASGAAKAITAAPKSQFSDETSADMPLRDARLIDELVESEEEPEALRKKMKSFEASLDSVYKLVHDPELLRDVISNLMIELKTNPQYIKLVAPTDIRVWIRSMREAMGLAQIKKTEKKATRKKSAPKVDTDMLADLEALGGIEL